MPKPSKTPKGRPPNKGNKVPLVALLVIIAALILTFIGRDVWLRRSPSLNCGDGPRRSIDMRDFSTEDFRYTVAIEAEIKGEGKLSAKLTPEEAQKLSEAIQRERDFQRYLVAGYNACAITKQEYAQDGKRFEALNGLAAEIDRLSDKSSLTGPESRELSAAISKYSEIATNLSNE